MMNAELVTYLEIDAKKKFNLVETFSDVTSLSYSDVRGAK